jgi:hypothetical protein
MTVFCSVPTITATKLPTEDGAHSFFIYTGSLLAVSFLTHGAPQVIRHESVLNAIWSACWKSLKRDANMLSQNAKRPLNPAALERRRVARPATASSVQPIESWRDLTGKLEKYRQRGYLFR